MKILIFLTMSFVSVACFADSELYVYKADDGSKLLSHKKITTQNYKQESVTYYPSENPITNKWYVSACQKDRFNGAKSCSINRKNLFVMIYNGKPSVFVGGADFPRQQSAIKIDQHKTIYGSEGKFKDSQAIINQMLKGEMVYIRYVHWPYEYNVDEEISLDGFADAYNELKQNYKEL